MDVFVELKGKSPLGVGFDVFDDEGGDCSGAAPFGLEEEEATGVGEGGPFFGPFEVGVIIDHDFQFVGQGGDIGKWGRELLWRQADPVPITA